MGTNEEQSNDIGNKGNKAFQKDYNFGIGKEEEIREFLENKMGYKIDVSEDEMSILDWSITHKNKKVNIELKSRRATKDQYEDTLIGANKLAEAWSKFYSDGEETLFFFSYTDGLYYINSMDYLPRRDHKLQRWGRGGIDKPKGWLYYDTKNLKKIY